MTRDTIRTITLVLLIGLGLIARGHPARAADSQVLTVAGGCFWCVEADFESVPGVLGVVSGYTGGTLKNPSYKQVSAGGTGHYEAVQIRFDPARVSRAQLLHMFFRSVDPTDAGGQFCDRGDSYRTAIFVSGKAERAEAQAAKAEAQGALKQSVVTPILPAGRFYPAEDYHQDYYKGTNLVITRAGPKRQSSAYNFYRKSCGRDQRVRQLWGGEAPFAGKHS
ncbi:peptide-methionine (S)-S-oxide reductase MsrA [Seohaeicola nanhaiensis]|uniref:Peptide methionine sulfoxide reductase MsrA n=1 Tax=Seohaeicola nanhaiensis TaxID=1387282 RepID=A0ABV9KGM9_9RHOB